MASRNHRTSSRNEDVILPGEKAKSEDFWSDTIRGPSRSIDQTPNRMRGVERIRPNRASASSRRILLRAIPLCVLFVASCARQEEISQQRIDGPDLAMVWTYDAGTPINQILARVGDVVLAVPSGGPLLALDAQTGELRWKYDPSDGVWDRAYAIDDDSVYVGVGGGRLVALEAKSGRVRWERDLGINVHVPPLVEGDVLYVPTTFVGPDIENNHDGRAKVFALDANDGREIWSFESANYILQTPIVYGDSLYLAGNFNAPEPVEEGGHTRLYSLNVADGDVRWIYESEDGFTKRLYATDSTVAFVGYQDFVNGVDAVSGQLRWRMNAGNWVPSLSGQDESIYFGSANTIVHALEVDSGEILWQHNIEHGTFNYVLGAPVRVEDELYFLTQHGDIMALDALSGALLWELPTGITSRVGLSVSGGWIFIGDEKGVVSAYSNE